MDSLPLVTSGSYAGIDWSNSGWGNDEGIAWSAVFTCTGSPTPTPIAAQFVSESLGYGNGTKTAWTTTYPFADGSLTVFVDRLDQTAAATITSAAAGTFTLGFAPLSSELVEVTYRGR